MIYIESAIGGGKSTLTKLLAKDLGSTPYLEDVNNGLVKGMLREFYSAGTESRSHVSGMLQVAFLTYRFQQLKKAITETNAVMDSNLLSDSLMASNLYQRGEMSDAVYNVYITLNQLMQSNVNGTPWNGFPDLIVYLDISLDNELKAIKGRGRDMEDIDKDPALVDYYRSVNQRYKDWYKGYSDCPVVRIDRNRYDFLNNINHRNYVLNTIEAKLVELGKLSESEFAEIKKKRNNSVDIFD